MSVTGQSTSAPVFLDLAFWFRFMVLFYTSFSLLVLGLDILFRDICCKFPCHLPLTVLDPRGIYWCDYTDFLRFEVLTAMTMQISIFFDITPYSPLKVNRRFGVTCLLHLQRRRIRQGRNQLEMSVDFQRTTWRYVSEDRTLHIDFDRVGEGCGVDDVPNECFKNTSFTLTICI
jgi:hypothetical protein